MASKRIFIAVLDWGLGHATRCIPIVNGLRTLNCEVLLGGSGRSLQLLKAEFPTLKSIELPAYNIQYFSSKMWVNMCWQWPKIIWAIAREHRQLQKIIDQYQIDGVIADSRFGCFSRKVPTVFISHQIHIRIPFSPLQTIVNRLNHDLIGKFSECWIPDFLQNGGLAGALSHPPLNGKTQYIGILSRMTPLQLPLQYPLVAVLSGPEPQRSYLEEKLIAQATELQQKLIIVQGKPEVRQPPVGSPFVHCIPFLTTDQLHRLLAQAGLIICRSGYTSLMDLAFLGKKALLIPTPGQTEQEYLAQQLLQKGVCHFTTQQNLDLEKDLERADNYPGFGATDQDPLQFVATLDGWIRSFDG